MVFVKDVLATNNVSLSKDATINDAVNLLGKSSEEAVVIVDTQNQNPICVFTERDLVKVLTNKVDLNKKIVDISSRSLITINHNRSVEYALSVLTDNNIRRVVAVDNDYRFVGIASQKHIVKYIEEESFKTNLLVSNIISQKLNLVTINKHQSIDDAILLMDKYKISSVVIVDEENNPNGIFTEKDVITLSSKCIPFSTKLLAIENLTPLQKVKNDDSLKDVVDVMGKKDISIALVVDNNNTPLSVISTRDIAHNIKGNYNRFLENRLKGVKNTLNYIGELVIEVCNDNNKQIIQWINEASINRFGHHIIDKEVSNIIGKNFWDEIYQELRTNQKCSRKKINIGNYFYETICSYHMIDTKETILLILRDVTDYENRVTTEVQKREEKEKELELVQNVINQQPSIIIVTSGEKIELVNKSFLDFYDVSSPKEFHEKFKCICDTFVAHPSFFHIDDNNGTNWIKKILQLPEKDRIVSIINVKTIEPKAFSIQVNTLLPNSQRYVVTMTDITDIKLESQRHYYHATHDALTKTYNRSFFLDKLDDEITYSSRYNAPFSLIIFDIDHFKRFNDSYGHLKGDEVLISVCEIVRLNIRKTDVFARWGGEEFVILLPNTPLKNGEILAQNLRKKIEILQIPEGLSITASFGLSEYQHGDTEKSIFKRADDALYKAKENGRNCIETI